MFSISPPPTAAGIKVKELTLIFYTYKFCYFFIFSEIITGAKVTL